MGTPNRRPRQRNHVWFHTLTAFFLLLSVFSPLIPISATAAPAAAPAAQQGTTPPPLPAPTQVDIAGSFQIALGCANDYDPTCPEVGLTDTGGGTWSGVFPIPPGTYGLFVVATSDQQRWLGEGGIPDGPETQLNVPEGAAGVYVGYNAVTGEITLAPVRNEVTLVTDQGDSFAMGPDSQGGYEVFFDSDPGNYGFQVQVDGQPVAQDVINLDAPFRVHVAIDDQGALTARETVDDTTVEVTRVGADGAPQPNACFAVETSNGAFAGQACDADDGAADGLTEIRFANGLPSGQYVVTEVTPNATELAEDQPVDLGPGVTTVTAPVAGEPAQSPETPDTGDEPADEPADDEPDQPPIDPGIEPGRLNLRATDEQGNVLPGACFVLAETNEELCDDDGDGDTLFTGLVPGNYTVIQTEAPDGFTINPEFRTAVEPGGQRVLVSHQPGEAPEPEPEPEPTLEPDEPAPGVSTLTLAVRDQNDAPLAGACFNLTNRDTGESFERCDDEDGAEDGTVSFADVPAGPYRLTQIAAASGATPANPGDLSLQAGESPTVTIVNQVSEVAQPGGVGNLVITVLDEANNPVPQTCFVITGAQDFGELCDQQNDGTLNLPEIPSGEYEVEQTQTAPGLEMAPPRTVQVPANGTQDLRLENLAVEAPVEPTAAPTVEPTVAPTLPPEQLAGDVLVVIETESGENPGVVCVTLSGEGVSGEVCDNEAGDANTDPGRILLLDVPTGNYTLAVAAPAGFEPVADQPVTVEADLTTRVDVILTTPAPVAGTLAITARDADGNPVAVCATLSGTATAGPVCDNEPGDDSGDAGRIVLSNLAGGDYTLAIQAPSEFEPVPDQAVTITPDQTLEIAVNLTPVPPANGTLIFITEDAGGQPVAGACYELELASGGQNFGSFCDINERGQVTLDEVPPADYVVTLTSAPDDDAIAVEPQSVTVASGGEETVTFQLEADPGSLTITARDVAGNPVTFCAALEGEATVGPVCDNQDGDSDEAAGVVTIIDLAAGDYTLTISDVPAAVSPPAPQPVTIVAGETTTLDLTLQPAPGRLEIRVEDEAGTLLPNACVTITGAALPEPLNNICDAQDDGILNFPDMPPGDYVIRQEQTAPDHQLAPDQQVTIPPGETVSTILRNPAVPEPTATATATPEPTATATPEPTATATAEPPVTATATAEPTATVEPTATAAVTVTPEPTLPLAPTQTPAPTPTPEPTGTGSVVLFAQDESGAPINGQCFLLSRANQELGPYCTGEDSAGPEGEVIANDLPAGVWEAVSIPGEGATAPTELDQVSSFQRANQRRTFTIRGGEPAPRVVFTFQAQQASTGDLLIVVRNDDNRRLAGACFGLYEADLTVAEMCDGDRTDGDGNDGRIRFNDIEAGTYRLSMLTAPAGYQLVQDQVVDITANRVLRVNITPELEPTTSTTLVVNTVDNAGNPLLGACYALQRGATAIGPVCGDDDNDGITTFTDLQGGAYLLRQTTPPTGYTRAPSQAFLLTAGQTATVNVVHVAQPGSVEIIKVDQAGELLGGACFRLLNAAGEVVYRICDNEQNDTDPTGGVLVLAGVAAGEYLVRESRAPAGFQRAADQTVTVTANRRSTLEFENAVLPPPPQRGNLTVFKIGPDERPLPGACFALLRDDQIAFGPRCDSDDGANDGTITFTGVGIGEFALSETRTPSGIYLPVDDQTVTVNLNQTTEVIVQNQFRPGRILVQKRDINQIPLQNACFVLEPSDGTPLCTNAAGNVIFSSLPPGTYRLVETQSPLGYLPADPVENIVVNPGATTTTTVVNELAPPPPNTGSVQIVKFFCPAGEDGEGTVFIDSSNPGTTQLAQTAGCTAGDARFSMISTSGEGGPGEFSTGSDGRFQTTLQAGSYNLNELEPNLPGNTTEVVRVFVNQMTTVVVLNYVLPPSPDPAMIDVIISTCAPGFQGTIFADFVDGCLYEENLTNNVTFRLSGETTARRITGDLGQQGVTRFSGLTPGIYTLRQEPPAANLSIFAFCGLDPDNPELREVGDSIQMRLSPGQQVTCYWFNVPDDLSNTTGSIVIHKYGCAATSYPLGYDWFGECEPQGPGVQFALSFFDGTQFVAKSTGATSQDGILRFNRLQPGTYQLQEIGAVWCHAESDSVNANGDVIVEAGQRANVWIFNCLGTKQPPNTGAGPLASLPSVTSGLGLALGLGWPGLILAGYAAYRKRWAA